MLNMLDELKLQNTVSAETSLNLSLASRAQRLPRIDVPKVAGNYSQWSHFRNLFTSIIIENSDLSAVEKLHYLKMNLTGEPAQHLKSIAISGKNFARALDSLVARYENKRMLIDVQITVLYTSRKTESAAALKQLLTNIKETLGALEALGCPVHYWDLFLNYMMNRKIDANSLKRWEETLDAQNLPTFTDLEAFLVSRIYILEALERSLPKNQQSNSTSSRSSMPELTSLRHQSKNVRYADQDIISPRAPNTMKRHLINAENSSNQKISVSIVSDLINSKRVAT